MPESNEVRDAGERVERLLAEITDPADRERAEDLVAALIQMYGSGLERIVRLVGDATARSLAADDLVGSLLIVHDLHPVSTGERVRAALERVRPYPGARLVELDPDGIVRVRLEGDAWDARTAIERAILTDAPEIVEVLVEGTLT
jgi:hypothetical protein